MARSSNLCFSFFFFLFLILFLTLSSPTKADDPTLGEWTLLVENIGVVAMHMQLLNNDRVIIFDRTDAGRSNISLPDGKCRNDSSDLVVEYDCTAHSVEYNVGNNSIRALTVLTDTWCSSGAVTADGVLVQTGGYNDGDRTVRTFQPCSTCDWNETNDELIQRRWYATNQILPNGQIIVMGGEENNYEFIPKTPSTNTVFNSSFLADTSYYYPFVYLNIDGNLFIFAYNTAILFNYTSNTNVKYFPDIPDYQSRTYPWTGSSVLLPLRNLTGSVDVEVLVCGGAGWGANWDAISGNSYDLALDTCARIGVNDQNPEWVMETMPFPRIMGDMTLLPNGQVLIINGCQNGSAGWEYGRVPVFNPVLYEPGNVVGSRMTTMNPTTIPRMYHSSALLLSDGRVLVGGSNPHQYYNFTGVLFPTELRLEAFSPPYLASNYSSLQPTIISPASHTNITYGQELVIEFSVSGVVNASSMVATMFSPTFSTHSFGHNQRLLVLEGSNVTAVTDTTYAMSVTTPITVYQAPPGYYVLFVVNQGIPSVGIWVLIN